jgi:hypothetical protein
MAGTWVLGAQRPSTSARRLRDLRKDTRIERLQSTKEQQTAFLSKRR